MIGGIIILALYTNLQIHMTLFIETLWPCHVFHFFPFFGHKNTTRYILFQIPLVVQNLRCYHNQAYNIFWKSN